MSEEHPETASRLRRPHPAGFTLVEALVVAAMGGLLAAIAFPSLSTALSAHRLMGGLRETIGAIRVARSVAVSRNQQSRIVVSGDATTLTIEMSPDGTTWTAIGQPVVLESGVTISSVSPSNGLQFASRGILSSAVTVTVRNARGNTHQIAVSLLGGVEIT